MKSAFFALLILWAAFLVSILFTRKITSALQRLYLGTERISEGKFDFQVPVRTKDEIGALSKAFNKMTREITRLLKETADKARMEKELETAQLVQDNFFPPEFVQLRNYEISSYFRPASECGGDWWGYFETRDSLVVLLGDVTGHGVGAAMITAATRSCTSILEWFHQRSMIKSMTIVEIMQALNTAVYHTGKKKVKMTFFGVMIDLKTGRMHYCNASQDRPLLYRFKTDATREDIEPLGGDPDPCLGQDLEVKFHEHRCELREGEGLILHTDGLTEGTNAKNEEFGARRFMHAVISGADGSARTIKDNVVRASSAFYGQKSPADDITLVVIKRRPGRQEVRLAS